MSKFRSILKPLATLVLVLPSNSWLSAQGSSQPFISEMAVSINQTNVGDANTKDHIGFGIGAYHEFERSERLSLVLGLEYNYTHQFKEVVKESDFVTRTNTDYYLNALSVPAGIRFAGGNELRYFVETGLYADLMVQSIRSGTLSETNSGSGSNPEISTFEERAGVSSFIGAYIGIGLQIPIAERSILIRPDYKLAFSSSELSKFEKLSNNYLRLQVGIRF